MVGLITKPESPLPRFRFLHFYYIGLSSSTPCLLSIFSRYAFYIEHNNSHLAIINKMATVILGTKSHIHFYNTFGICGFLLSKGSILPYRFNHLYTHKAILTIFTTFSSLSILRRQSDCIIANHTYQWVRI